jgi:hypothetical protein
VLADLKTLTSKEKVEKDSPPKVHPTKHTSVEGRAGGAKQKGETATAEKRRSQVMFYY